MNTAPTLPPATQTSPKALITFPSLGIAFDAQHVVSILLIIAVVVVPIALNWQGPFSWQTMRGLLPGALLSVYTLLRQSPADLMKKLTGELLPSSTTIVSTAVTTTPPAPPAAPATDTQPPVAS